MPKSAVAFKRSDTTRLIRAAHDAGLTVTAVLANREGEIRVETSRATEDQTETNEDTRPNTFDQVLRDN